MSIRKQVFLYEKVYDPILKRTKVSEPKIATLMGPSNDNKEYSILWVYNIFTQHKPSCTCLDCLIPTENCNAKYWGPESDYGMPDKFWQYIYDSEKTENTGSRFSSICSRLNEEVSPTLFQGELSWNVVSETVATNGGAVDIMPGNQNTGTVIVVEPGSRIVIYKPQK